MPLCPRKRAVFTGLPVLVSPTRTTHRVQSIFGGNMRVVMLLEDKKTGRRFTQSAIVADMKHWHKIRTALKKVTTARIVRYEVFPQ